MNVANKGYIGIQKQGELSFVIGIRICVIKYMKVLQLFFWCVNITDQNKRVSGEKGAMAFLLFT